MVSREEAKYLQEHYKRFSDKELSQALRKSPSSVRKALKEIGCQRTDEDLRYIHSHPEDEPPPYASALMVRGKWLLSLSFFIPLVVYLSTTTSCPAGNEGTELGLCAYGVWSSKTIVCPIYLLIGRVLSCVSFVEFSLLLNLLSVICGAICVWLIARLLYRLSGSILVSLLLSLFVAFSIPFWKASVTTSPVAPALFFCALSLHYLLLWQASHRQTYLILASLSCIMSVGLYAAFLAFVPLFCLFLLAPFIVSYPAKWVAKLGKGRKRAISFSCVAFPLLFAEIYLSFPLCSYRSWDVPRRYAQEIWKNVDTGAVIVTGDETTRRYLLYDSLVSHKNRPGHICDFGSTDKDLAYLLGSDREKLLDALLQKYPLRPIYFTYLPTAQEWHRYHLFRKGVVWQAIPISLGKPLLAKGQKTIPDWPELSPNLAENERKFLAHCHFVKAIAHLEQGEVYRALKSLEQAKQYYKPDKSLLLPHAQVFSYARQYREALELYELLARQEPEAQLYLSMARLENMQGHKERARAFYEKALSLIPNSFNALLELAEQCEREENWAKAKELYQRLIERYKEHPYPYQKLAKILAKDPETHEKARHLLQKAQELEKKQKAKKDRLSPASIPKTHRKPQDPFAPKLPEPVPKLPALPKIPKTLDK
jgi:tetratricopeptide (TPR) repeat protein